MQKPTPGGLSYCTCSTWCPWFVMTTSCLQLMPLVHVFTFQTMLQAQPPYKHVCEIQWLSPTRDMEGEMGWITESSLSDSDSCCRQHLSSPAWNAGATLVAFACNGPELLTNSCSIYLNDESVGLSEQMTQDNFCYVAHQSLLSASMPCDLKRWNAWTLCVCLCLPNRNRDNRRFCHIQRAGAWLR